MSSLQRRNEQSPIEKGLQKMDEKTLQNMDKLFQTAFYLAWKERPFTDFPDFLDLQTLNGPGVWGTYYNDKAAKEFITHIAEIYQDNLQKQLHNSDYFSVYCDESTDRSESEKELVMVRVIEDFYPVVKYLKLVEPANTKADDILAGINAAFADFGFSAREYKQKMIGFGSDGASVMMGARRVKDCLKGTFMDNVTETLTLIYYFYKGSTKRDKEVSEVAEIVEEHFYTPEKENRTRWVDHKLRSAANLIANGKLIAIHLQRYIEDKSNKAEDRAKGKGILKKVMEYKLIWFLHFRRDVLNEIARLSLLLQREDVTLPRIMIKVQSVQVALSEMMDNPGRNLQRFQEELNGALYKEHTLTHVVAQNSLTQEKKNYPRIATWPDEDAALTQYGRNELQVITDYFQHILNNCGCDVDSAFSEWTALKLHVKNNPHFRVLHQLSLWQRISLEDVERNEGYPFNLSISHG
ncbi:Zinc finger protein 862 [Acropora cervicornis]|uniref:Zinc finger protein 862 n=1 Tax=Acropora cervicornis TaxID=6130 RepID=A0AAD9UWY7_ACRCE|nr:Zinc finger protein 862 [Acropora cervicornis]